MSKNGNHPLHFGLFYDFRNPLAWQRPYTQIYGEIFEQIRWADQHGFDNVWLSEHHLCEDGYAPSVLPIAAASAVPLTHYYSFTLPPGLPASWIQPHLELFADKVIPAFR